MSAGDLDAERLGFDVTYDGGVTRCRLISEFGEGVIDRNVAEVWPDLYEAYGHVPPEQNPFFTHGVNNNNGEEVAVYLGLAWELTGLGQREVLISRGVPDVERYTYRDDIRPTRWEYRTQAEAANWSGRAGTFGRAVNARGPGYATGLYTVDSRRELVDLLVASLDDAWATVLIVGRPRDATPTLVERLTDRRRPTLPSLVAGGGVAVDVTIGVDLGCYDSLEIVMDGDRRADFDGVVRRFRQRIAAYEATLTSVRSLTQFRSALDFLAGVDVLSDEDGGKNYHRWLVGECPALTALVIEHLADNDGEVLLHPLTAGLARIVEHEQGSLAQAAVELMEAGLGAADDDIVDAVAVSFVERLEPWSPEGWERAQAWPEALRNEAQRKRH